MHHVQILKIKTSRMMNEERCRSRLRSQFVSASALFFSSFFFFSLISLNFSQCWTLEPFTQPPSCLFIAKDSIKGHGSSPRRVDYFTPKLFGGLGKLEASLGEPGFRKKLRMTLLSSPLGIFRILDQNIE